jgi:hypothetical protein
LDLSNNKFDGQIPSSLGNLKKLYSLKLSFNNFSGKISNGFLTSHGSLGWTSKTTSLMVRFHPHLETLRSYIP